MKSGLKILSIVIFVVAPLAVLNAQTKKNKPRKPVVPAVTATPKPTPEPTPEPGEKKNNRPTDAGRIPSQRSESNAYAPTYFYEFDRPGFTYPRILIEHDESGKGKISFNKDGFDELLTDPIELTPVTMDKLKAAFAALAFLDSTENYQYAAHDFSNMGNVTITLKRDGRSRVAKYNWTENKDAKFLMDEYRRIGNEYTWKFEITVARQNQPLQTPGLMDALDGYIKRGEISDPPHLVPFLTELSTDERLPLIARNHADKLVKLIEKVA